MKANSIGAIFGIAILALMPASLGAQTPTTPAPPAQTAPLFQPAELDQLLAPVALYPDELLGQILMASTYPLEVVEAQRWVEDPSNARLKGDQLTAALQDKDWDPSVKSLVPFPQILVMMSNRLDWMQKLGDAFLAQQGDVMDAVQRLRQQAQAAGTLQSSPQQTVNTQDQAITIEPANPDNVYVPVYDPTVVYGDWAYPDYPPYYFPPPPGFVFGPPIWPGFWWGPVIQINFYRPFWGWDRWDWRQHRIHVDRDRFDRIEGKHRFPAGDTWQHDPYHRRGVAYRDPRTGAKFGQPVTGSPDARRIYRGFGDTSTRTQGIAPRRLIRPGTTSVPGASVTAPGTTAPRRFVRPGTTTAPGTSVTTPDTTAPRRFVRPGTTTAPGTSVTTPDTTAPRRFVRPGTTTAPGTSVTTPDTTAPRRFVKPGTTAAPGTSVTAPASTTPRSFVPRSFVKPGATTTTPSRQTAVPTRQPAVQRPQGTLFGGYGRGPDIRAQSERGRSSQQTISPRSFKPSVSTPRPSSTGKSSSGRIRRQ